jgi:hypothetical protein
MIYGCRRSASVQSANYSTLASLVYKDYKEITQKFRKIISCFKQSIDTYADENRLFILRSLNKLPFFQSLNEEDKNYIIFNFNQVNYEKGNHVQ